MIEIAWDEEHGCDVVRDGDRVVFGIEVTGATWKLYSPGRYKKPAGPGLCLEALFSPAAETGSQRLRCLEWLESKWQSEQSFRRVLDFVGPIIEYFYVNRSTVVKLEEHWIHAAQGAKLCRLFLDFLDPRQDPDRAERYHAARVLLQRTYYFSLACLYEERAAIARLPAHTLIRVYLEGWDLEREFRATLRRWHGIILEPSNGWLFQDVLGRDQEQEMWSVLVRGDSRRFLRRFFREPAGREFVDHVITHWFLPRYDLTGAQALHRAVSRSTPEDEDVGVEVSFFGTHLPSVAGLALGVLFLVVSLPIPALSGMQTWVPVGVVMASLALLAAGLCSSLFGGSARVRFLLPNLFAAVVVGYFALVLGGDPWKLAMRLADAGPLRPPRLVTGAGVFLGFPLFIGFITFAYLLSRTEPVSPGGAVACQRACHVFCRGLSYSFLIGVVAVDLMGSRLLDPAGVERTLEGPLLLAERVTGLTGPIYPAVVWVFLWVALFVGVLVQVWWEDKAVTESR